MPRRQGCPVFFIAKLAILSAAPCSSGVESAIFNMDGTFDAVHSGTAYRLMPLSGIQARAINPGEQAAIVINADGTLTYTVSDGAQAFSMTMRIETR